MQEQIQQTACFLADNDTIEQKPYLSELFNAVDQLIVKCAEKNNVDLTELKRFVAGHVAKEDSREFEERFQVFEKRKIPTTDWNALVSIASNKTKRSRFNKETSVEVKKLSEILSGDDKARAEELRTEVEAQKKIILERKQQNKANAANEDQDPFRLVQYKKDLEKLDNNMRYMYLNYGSCYILVSANEDQRKQIQYPPFAIGNSGKTNNMLS